MFQTQAGPQYTIKIGSVDSFESKLEKVQENFTAENKIKVLYEDRFSFGDSLLWLLPLVIIIIFWLFIMRRMRTGGGMGDSMMKFGKITTKPTTADDKNKVTFEDVAGLKEAKVEIMEVVDFLDRKSEEHTSELQSRGQ